VIERGQVGMALKPYRSQEQLEAGCDEAGRGCLAGPVVAAAVILPKEVHIPELNDSKKLSASARERVTPLILQQAIATAIGVVSVAEIDSMNILNASILAMHRAVDALTVRPEFLLIDGNRFTPYPEVEHVCVIGGDACYRSIAAASVLAKTHRDRLMVGLHSDWPEYAWDRNKGYPSKEHRAAIARHGACDHHRKTFRLLSDQLTLF